MILKRLNLFRLTDWLLVGPAILISFAGLVTMNSFVGNSPFADRQIVWIVISVIIFPESGNVFNIKVAFLIFSTSLLA